ncbi:MAG TPA: hypothetical protein PK006_08950 [Saprospiraceae bacterium]|nr:hypothetical protein [Saprospiraceae bacterium]
MESIGIASSDPPIKINLILNCKKVYHLGVTTHCMSGQCLTGFAERSVQNGVTDSAPSPTATSRSIKPTLLFAKKICCLFFTCWIVTPLCAQLPVTQLYSLHYKENQDKQYSYSDLNYLSSFNSKGYNNQPYIIKENQFFATIYVEESKQTDIFLFDLDLKEYRNLTRSQDSEYSPRLHPTLSESFTTVKVPTSDSNSQWLTLQNLNSGLTQKVLLDEQGKIGYYRWIKDKTWVCFLVDEHHKMAVCTEGSLSKLIFAEDVGRSFEVFNEEIYFVHKTKDANLLKKYNIRSSKSEILALMPTGSEDFCIKPNGDLICSHQNRFLRLNEAKEWTEFLNLPKEWFHNIQRFSISDGQIVFVELQNP